MPLSLWPKKQAKQQQQQQQKNSAMAPGSSVHPVSNFIVVMEQKLNWLAI